MAIFLALASAFTYGASDFLGGVASRRAAVISVLATTQCTGLIFLLIAVPVLGDSFVGRDCAIGAAGGLAGVFGLFCFYRSLALGPMSITAPLSAVTSALVPLTVGLALGERPGPTAVVGVPLALLAIVLFSRGEPTADRAAVPRAAIGLSVAAGFGFGAFFVALDKVSAASGLWPVLAGRGVSTTIAVVACVAARKPLRLSRPTLSIAIPAGIGETSANVLVLLANRYGLLSIVSVIASLYPVTTVVLAQTILYERFTRVHAIGAVSALAAVVLVALA